jgi:hypothetical protein
MKESGKAERTGRQLLPAAIPASAAQPQLLLRAKGLMF